MDTSASEIDLLLKSQSSSGWGSGVIEVLYEPANNRVQVWTFTSAQNWVQRGADLSVTFANGDQFGARAKSNGQVEVYKNGTLLGSRDVTAWPYYASTGYIGLWMVNASNALLDDFGGGTATGGFIRARHILARPAYAVSSPPTGQTWKSYYYANGKPIAMRVQGDPVAANNGLFYLLTDHLGSNSAVVAPDGGVTRQYYYPYGGVRPSGANVLPTNRTFTGQTADDTGSYYYRARY